MVFGNHDDINQVLFVWRPPPEDRILPHLIITRQVRVEFRFSFLEPVKSLN